jgi:predicted RNase H-like HicB family nuclease
VNDTHYHINLFWSDEDDAFIADIPDLQYCSAVGDTPEAALREVLIAMHAWLESARDHGDPIPAPHYRPLIYQVA